MRPSILSIINTDWPALFLAISLPMIIAITALHPLFFPSSGGRWDLLAYLGLPVAAISFGLMVWRVRRVINLFKNGIVYSGKVTRIQLTKGRGRIDFTYRTEQGELRTWQPVHQTKRVLAIRIGQEISVLAKPSMKQIAIIKELF